MSGCLLLCTCVGLCEHSWVGKQPRCSMCIWFGPLSSPQFLISGIHWSTLLPASSTLFQLSPHISSSLPSREHRLLITLCTVLFNSSSPFQCDVTALRGEGLCLICHFDLQHTVVFPFVFDYTMAREKR